MTLEDDDIHDSCGEEILEGLKEIAKGFEAGLGGEAACCVLGVPMAYGSAQESRTDWILNCGYLNS